MTTHRPAVSWPLLVAILAALASTSEAEPVLTDVALTRLGASATAESQCSDLYGGPKAIDGTVGYGSVGWFAADSVALPCSLNIDLGATRIVHSIVLYQASWGGSMYHSREVRVEGRLEGEWVGVGEAVLPDVSEHRTEVRLGSPMELDAVRIVVLSGYIEPQICGLAEVEVLASGVPTWGEPRLLLDGEPAPDLVHGTCGLAMAARAHGPQVLLSSEPPAVAAVLDGDESAAIGLDLASIPDGAAIEFSARRVWGGPGRVIVSGSCDGTAELVTDTARVLRVPIGAGDAVPVTVELHADGRATAIELRSLALVLPGLPPLAISPTPSGASPLVLPLPAAPVLREGMERLLIEWDWRMQDGIATPRLPVSYEQACDRLVERGNRLAKGLRGGSDAPKAALADWREAVDAWRGLPESSRGGALAERAWLDLHWARRSLMLAHPLMPREPILFAKRVPSAFSHQLTQYYGRYARPGGGIFVLPEPGRSMACRDLTGGHMPLGSYLHPEVSYDADRVLFAFCETDSAPTDSFAGSPGHYYHLYEMPLSGGVPSRLTEGAFDDFAPRYLPGGDLMFISTRRLGWHRCGTPGCENYTLTRSGPDGSMARPVSFHETQEWDPVVLHDGRIAYTRWDYVDRHAVYYEQLWWTHPDGGNPSALYGNNTFNPVGIWEPRPVPGSDLIMATAAAHHAMTAGSIILIDPRRGVDGPEPIVRLTPDTPFPESESVVSGTWVATAVGCGIRTSEEQERWPGHCYRSPYPLSEDLFLASYSFEPLVGEPHANSPTMFGLYLVDTNGNRELLYRDLAISSLWPIPIQSRLRPPPVGAEFVPSVSGGDTGTFLVQNINRSSVALPDERIAALRVVQLVPKSTSGANNPMVGLANASPGKQVLGTVPVSDDGSAYFEAPAGIPLAFQALDSRGMAVQVMRSVTYLQPGQNLGCIGCHEDRTEAPPNLGLAATGREPAKLRPAPDGARPLSYPILVQPVLDRNCVSCHGADEPAGGVRLTGEPEGAFSVSYNQLAPRVSFSAWTGAAGFEETNSEPLSTPDFFGARGSALWQLLEGGHYDVDLSAEDTERLVTWMDTNALFYGTFDPADQARQQRGERIEGPAIE